MIDFRREEGQATAEYALVLVAAGVIALALILWASNSDVLPGFFETVVRKVASFVDRV
ncbi:MAG: DUF4244 domain-containing protein [Acidimicrobiia bacterium]|nr:DUF4244 domain-containing protein [Acidimicrobiia bacterium]NNC74006.1 DUF4244 domain-containing protein [Acidimicrobiia bacterium]